MRPRRLSSWPTEVLQTFKAPARSTPTRKPRPSPYGRGPGGRRSGGGTGGANPARKGGRVPNKYGAYTPVPKVAPLRSLRVLRWGRSHWFVAAVVLLTLAELAVNELLKRRKAKKKQAKDLLTQNHRKKGIETSGSPERFRKPLQWGEMILIRDRYTETGTTWGPEETPYFDQVWQVLYGPGELKGVERASDPEPEPLPGFGTTSKKNGTKWEYKRQNSNVKEEVFIGAWTRTEWKPDPFVDKVRTNTRWAEKVVNDNYEPLPLEFVSVDDSAPSAFGAPLRVFEPDPSPAPDVAPAPAVPSIAPARAPVQPAPAPAPGEAQPAPSPARTRTAAARAPAASAPKAPANAESMAPNGRLQPRPTPPPPPTPPGTTFLPGGIPLPGNGPRPTPAGTSGELGKLEKKLELALAPDGPLSLLDKINRVIDQIENIKFVVDALLPPQPYIFSGGNYQLSPVCERDSEGQPLPPRIAPWTSGEGEITEVNKKLDALAQLVQFHKELKQPTCKGPAPIGEGVTVTFEEIQE